MSTADQDSLPAGDLETTVLQEEAPALPLAPVPVTAAEVIPVRVVTSRRGMSRKVMVPNTAATRILDANPRRRRVLIWSFGNVYVAFGPTGQSECQALTAATILSGAGPYEFSHGEEVWAMGDPAGVPDFFVYLFAEDSAD